MTAPLPAVAAPPPAAAVVLAAGEGTRMRSPTPKVLHTLCGRTLLGHVLAALAPLEARETFVVVGAARAEVEASLPPGVRPVLQAEQRGTGHAVAQALAQPRWPAGPADTVLVTPGDTPLLTTETLAQLLRAHAASGAAVTVLTARMPDPTGYGRVVRDPGGGLAAIVEHADADAATRAISEVNAGVYALAAGPLAEALAAVGSDNAQGEQYLTDVVGWLRAAGHPVAAHPVADPAETLGVNDQLQLAAARRAFRDRLVGAAMRAGATVTDPLTTWMGVAVRVAPGATIHQNVQMHGRTLVEAGATVGPDVTLRDTVVRRGAVVHHAVCTGAVIGPGASVGPYVCLDATDRSDVADLADAQHPAHEGTTAP